MSPEPTRGGEGEEEKGGVVVGIRGARDGHVVVVVIATAEVSVHHLVAIEEGEDFLDW